LVGPANRNGCAGKNAYQQLLQQQQPQTPGWRKAMVNAVVISIKINSLPK